MSQLDITDLKVTFKTGDGDVNAVNALSLNIAAGETLAIVGESGSGKSQTAFATMGLLARNDRATGSVKFDGKELLGLPTKDLNKVRSQQIGMILQDPMTSLNPYMRINDQMAEVLTLHEGMSKREAITAAIHMLDAVGIPDAANRIRSYPHEFSGGLRQRIMVAMSLLCRPKLLIADEPTTALDVSVQAQVVNLLMELQRDLGLSMIFIAHDLSVVKHISDRIVGVYLGRQMETASAQKLTTAPEHPYTQALISSVPVPDPALEKARVRPILEGELPSPLAPPSGCVFRTRCPKVQDVCAHDRPAMIDLGRAHRVACPFHAPAQVILTKAG